MNVKEFILKSGFLGRAWQLLNSFKIVMKQDVQIVRIKTNGDSDLLIVRCPDIHVDKVMKHIIETTS